MGLKKRKTKKGKAKKYRITLSRTSLFLWTAGLFFLLAWIFVLGILAGRGFIPEGMQDLAGLTNRVTGLRNFGDHDTASELDQIKQLEKEPEFGFYTTLSDTAEDRPENGASQKKRKTKPPRTADQPPSPPSAAGYTVQLAALEDGLQALKMVSQLVEQGYPAFFNAASVNGKLRYRVRCGRFDTRRDAREMAADLAREENLTGFVTRHEE